MSSSSSSVKLEDYLNSKNYKGILALAQRRELEDGGSKTDGYEFYYCLQLVANLLLNDIGSARFLWKRLPKDLKKIPKI